MRASLLGQSLILIQDAFRLRRHQLQVLAVAGFLPCGACRLQLREIVERLTLHRVTDPHEHQNQHQRNEARPALPQPVQRRRNGTQNNQHRGNGDDGGVRAVLLVLHERFTRHSAEGVREAGRVVGLGRIGLRAFL